MNWLQAETAIRDAVEAGWALTAYAAIPLVWENELAAEASTFVAITIEGGTSEKSLYGSVGMRSSVEPGIVFFHAFVPVSSGKDTALGLVITMTGILELSTVGGAVYFEGANPPSPIASAASRDRELPAQQPEGMYYRCSASAPFIVVGAR